MYSSIECDSTWASGDLKFWLTDWLFDREGDWLHERFIDLLTQFFNVLRVFFFIFKISSTSNIEQWMIWQSYEIILKKQIVCSKQDREALCFIYFINKYINIQLHNRKTRTCTSKISKKVLPLISAMNSNHRRRIYSNFAYQSYYQMNVI